MRAKNYDWKRFWCPWDGNLNMHDGGYLADPDGPYGHYWNADLRSFDSIEHLPCLVMLGEPGIGKTRAMEAEREAVSARVRAGGGDTLWLDLHSCGSEYQLIRKLFESRKFTSWLSGDYHLHVFLDSLDEYRLRVENVAAFLADELRDHPTKRLSLRISCRTADWSKTLEDGLKELWDEESVGIYELAPLRRVDVAAAAAENGLNPDVFVRAVHEAGAVPLATKPVTLGFLLESYGRSGRLPFKQTELYLDGCRRLCEERDKDRVEVGRVGKLSSDQRLAVAARIAAVTIFSNRSAVWVGLERADLEESDVLVRELAGGTESVGKDEFGVREADIKEVLGTGLFSARGPERLGWAHQTYAEFLAARYLKQTGIGTEQAMSLIVHPDDEQGRLVPQLQEVAAWLASMSPEIFRAVMDADPEVLLRSDVASTDMEYKAALAGTLLRLYDEEKLLDLGLVPTGQYRKLEHPGLAEQLRPYIADADKGIVVRRVALDIAEACELRALQEDIARVALDADQDLLVRKEAARFVARVGDGPMRALLKPLAMGEAGDDPDDDLRGNGLRAVWPEQMSTDELFGSLKPPRTDYAGSYMMFLNHELPDRLKPDDLPAALAWTEEQERRHGMSYRLADLMDRVISRAWEHLDIPEVRKAFAKAALARLGHRDEIVQERSSAATFSEEPSFHDRIANDNEKRRGLVEELLDLVEDKEEDSSVLVYSRTSLVLDKDVAWLIERLEETTSTRKRSVLAALIRRAFNLWDNEQHELVYDAYQRNPALADEVRRYFDAVDLSSEEAKKAREYQEEDRRRREEGLDRPPLDPSPAEMIVRELDGFEAGDADAFWRLNYYMIFDERGFPKTHEAAWDLTQFPGWETAEGVTQVRIIEAAERYVLEGDPRTGEWLGKEQPHRPALAGYRALRMLMNLVPDFVAEMPTDTWEKWIPAILDYPITLGDGKEGSHLDLAAMAYRRLPEQVIDTTLLLINKENEEQDFLSVTRILKNCWDDKVARALLDKAKDARLRPLFVESLLEDLLDYGLDEAEEFAKSLVAEYDRSGEARSRALVAAQALIFHTDDAGWAVVWPIMREDVQFGRQLVESFASGARHSGIPQNRLSEQQVADLYIWMVRQYPLSEYFLPRGGGSIGYRENMGMWRDDVLRHLQGRGTVEACRQIERIGEEIPELQDQLKWVLYQARAETRRKTWTAPQPQHVLGLTARHATRLVQNGDQLLEVVAESLERLEDKLQGEGPMVYALWNEFEGKYRPKNEEWLSDFVKAHLEQDLAGRGIVVNREVAIRWRRGSIPGERTDIHVDATVPNDGRDQLDIATVVIEVKGCWNPELRRAMKTQLVDRYLKDNDRCRHGMYLVGWFNCDQWDDADSRKIRAPSYGLDVAREKFEEQARQLCQGDLRVRSVVLNTAIR